MPAVVGFIGGALGIGAASGLAGFAAGAAFAGTALGGIAIRLTASVALSALARAIAPKPKITIPGLRTDQTLTGGVNPEAIILGRFATAGALAAPLMSHGTAGKTPNAYLTYVVELAGRPGHQLDGLLINGEPVEILPDSPHADYGQRIGGRFEGRAWVRYHDGTQTAADPMLLAKYPAPHVRPWSADMVGHGLCHAILTFRYDREVYTQFPSVKFVLTGLPLYDPRLDSTAGGAGPMRWDDPGTWAPTRNLAVIIYNILRGIDLGGDTWGGGIPAEDLPYAVWATAMDACDAQLSDGSGGTEAAFEGGMEVLADDEPFGVIEELLKGCNGMLSESGGVWSIRIGGPALPVLAISDGDILSDAADDYRPFPPLSEIYNAIEATWTDPGSAWAARDAAPRYNPDWEAEDGGRRLTTSVPLPVVLRGTQADRVMAALIADHRRMRVHQITLPPRAERIRPLETITWTSDSNGYLAKLFEVVRVDRELLTGRVRVTLREIDAGDFAPPVVVRPTPPDLAPQLPAPQGVPGWDVEPWVIEDGAGAPRRPAVRAVWDPDGADDARGIRIAVRLAGEAGAGTEVGMQDLRAGAWVHDAALPGQAYQLRARLVVDRPTAWSAWRAATAPDVRLSMAELDAAAQQRVEELEDWIFDHAEIDQDIASVAQRATALETTTGEHSSRLATAETAITTQTGAIATLNQRVAVASEANRIVRDGTFQEAFAEWPGGNLQIPARLIMRDPGNTQWWRATMPAERAFLLEDFDAGGWIGTGRREAAPETEFTFGGDVAIRPNSRTARIHLRFYNSAGTQLLNERIDADPAKAEAWQRLTRRVVSPIGTASAELYIIGSGTGTQDSWFTNLFASSGADAMAVGALKIESVVDGDGSSATLGLGVQAGGVETGMGQAAAFLRAESSGASEILLNANAFYLFDSSTETAPFAYAGGELYLNARVTAEYLTIDRLLAIAPNAGFTYGKASAGDNADGIYLGVSSDGFGLSASRTNNDRRQRLRLLKSSGLELLNARHLVSGTTAETRVTHITDLGRTALPAGISRIQLDMVGGGAGGLRITHVTHDRDGNPVYSVAQGNPGTATIVRLYDGSLLRHEFSAAGGAGSTALGGRGQDSPWGAGGSKATSKRVGDEYINYPAGAGAGYGAGGGGPNTGSSRGGDAGAFLSTPTVDTSGWADPQIEIVIGSRGAGHSYSNSYAYTAGAGSPGRVVYTWSADKDIPADVIPLEATDKGAFVKTHNVAGSFPDLGAGLWVIFTRNNDNLNLGSVTVDDAGSTIFLWDTKNASFVSSRTPTYPGNANTRTIDFLFFPMGSWG